MKFYVTFQEINDKTPGGRPIDHQSTADFEMVSSDAAAIPNVGDYIEIHPFERDGSPQYQGVVKTRLFRFIGKDQCQVNIVVDTSEEDAIDWGKLIKE